MFSLPVGNGGIGTGCMRIALETKNIVLRSHSCTWPTIKDTAIIDHPPSSLPPSFFSFLLPRSLVGLFSFLYAGTLGCTLAGLLHRSGI